MQTTLFESDIGKVTERIKRPYTYTETITEALQEGSYDAPVGEVTITVIKPGFNLSGKRFYPADVLKRDYKVFEGAKMFIDHATADQDKARPEGSINTWAGILKRVWAEDDGTIKGKAVIIDEGLKSKLSTLANHGMLGQMGISIRATGEVKETIREGRKTDLIERLNGSRSVDFVTFAGAGGRVEVLESESSEQLTNEENIMNDELQVKLQEALGKVNAAEAERDSLKKEVETIRAQHKAQAELTVMLAESGLPDMARNRIQKQFSEATGTDGMADAIKAEKEYIDQLSKVTPVQKTVVKNLGESTPTNQTKPDLKKSFMALGLTESAAEIAARGRIN